MPYSLHPEANSIFDGMALKASITLLSNSWSKLVWEIALLNLTFLLLVNILDENYPSNLLPSGYASRILFNPWGREKSTDNQLLTTELVSRVAFSFGDN